MLKDTKANRALSPKTTPQAVFTSDAIRSKAFYSDDNAIILHGDAKTALGWLAEAGIQVDCVVTSPPYYGQRDYGVDNQIGLEPHPAKFIAQLIEVFDALKHVVRDTGSVWVNLGDTYWSGKGQHRSGEKKQSARRFGMRPQDAKGDGQWCRPKQLLLIPHRFAIAMQDAMWLVRNDNVWIKPNPIPDQVRDRCSMSHEYVFHFVKERWYYFNRDAVGRPSAQDTMLPPLDTWTVVPARGNGTHKAAFDEELVRVPVLATTPQNGIVLDPFGGSGTTLAFARKMGYRCIGIDLKEEFCNLMVAAVKAQAPTSKEADIFSLHVTEADVHAASNPGAELFCGVCMDGGELCMSCGETKARQRHENDRTWNTVAPAVCVWGATDGLGQHATVPLREA